MLKKSIYLLVIIIFIIVYSFKFGFFDHKNIKIDNFIIEKPFLYRSHNKDINIRLENYKRESVHFSSDILKNVILYDFIKIVDKHKYKLELQLFVKFNKLDNFDMHNCNIIKVELGKSLNNIVQETKIYKYPYIISLLEINKEREEKIIKQVCINSKINLIDKR